MSWIHCWVQSLQSQGYELKADVDQGICSILVLFEEKYTDLEFTKLHNLILCMDFFFLGSHQQVRSIGPCHLQAEGTFVKIYHWLQLWGQLGLHWAGVLSERVFISHLMPHDLQRPL